MDTQRVSLSHTPVLSYCHDPTAMAVSSRCRFRVHIAAAGNVCLICRARNRPQVRLAIKTLDGVRRLLNLMKTGDDEVVNAAALALSTVLQVRDWLLTHVHALALLVLAEYNL